MDAGALIQLVSHGAQDTYLTGNPQITFFKSYYRRHSAFAIEDIAVPCNNVPAFGQRVSFTIARNGDLLRELALEIRMPDLTKYVGWYYLFETDTQSWRGPVAPGAFDEGEYPINASGVFYYPPAASQLSVQPPYGKQARVIVQDKQWCHLVGYRLLKEVSLEIGGQLIDRLYSDWLYIWSELTTPPGKYDRLDGMRGSIEGGTVPEVLHIPLPFWFHGNPGLALPLVALQYHEVRLVVSLETFANLVVAQTPSPLHSVDEIKLWCSYVFLDTDERRRYAHLTHEILIDQLQLIEDRIAGTEGNTKIPFKNPVKEIIWTVQKEDATSWLDLSGGGSGTFYAVRDVDPATWSANGDVEALESAGWTMMSFEVADESYGADDEGFFTIPDIGFDLYLAGSNVRDKIEVYTNFYIKFDGLGTATLGNEFAYNPDQNTPSANAIHFGSEDKFNVIGAYKVVQENGINVVKIHMEGEQYDGNGFVQVCEVSIFQNGDIRISLPPDADLLQINAGNFGLTDGKRWVYYIPPPLQGGKSYTLNYATDFTVNYQSPSFEPSLLMVTNNPNDQYLVDIHQSRFTQITIYPGGDLSEISSRPDVIYMHDNYLYDPGPATLMEWVAQGSLLVLNAAVLGGDISAYGLFQTTFTEETLTTDNWFSDLVPNDFLKSVQSLSYKYGTAVDIASLAEDVEILGQPNDYPDYACLYVRRVGAGAILMDHVGDNSDHVNYRVQFWTELYNYVTGTSALPTVPGSPVEQAQLTLNRLPRFEARKGSYFTTVQPYQHHTRVPTRKDIHVYSFALSPEEHQPSGSLNFSRIDTAILKTTINYGTPSRIRVFAKSVNVLRIMGGMAGLAFVA